MDTAHADRTKVFLVEDSAPLRARLAAMLSTVDNVCVVGEAATAAAAIAGILKTRPTFVMLDIHLAGGSGLAVLREIHKADAAIVFIVLTSEPAPQYRKAYMQAGASHFLDKARDFEMARDIVAAHAARADAATHC